MCVEQKDRADEGRLEKESIFGGIWIITDASMIFCVSVATQLRGMRAKHTQTAS